MQIYGAKKLTQLSRAAAFSLTGLPAALRGIAGLAVVGQLFVLLALFGALKAWIAVGLLGCWVVWLLGVGWRWVLVVLPLIALACYPPVAFDETLYHLPTIRAIAQSGAIRFVPDLRFPVFPQLHELLCVPVFVALGDTATHFVAVLEVLLLAMLLFEWRGALAVALVLGNPIVMQVGSVTYVEAAVMLFVAAGFYCLEREHYALAGFLLGTACSVKYLGLYFAFAGLLYAWRKAPRYLLGLTLGALPMYAWITWTTGNPVFPFFSASIWNPRVTHPPVNEWRLLWDITFARGRVNWQPPYSPLFAISIAITLIVAVIPSVVEGPARVVARLSVPSARRAPSTTLGMTRLIAALCLGYLAVFSILPQDSRYLLPLLPLVSVVAAAAIKPKHVLALSLLVALPGIAYAGYRIAKQGIAPRHVYLEQHIPELRALEHRGPGRIWVCGAEQLKYYGGDDLVGDVFGPFRTMPPDARYVLISHRRCAAPPGFRLVYADDAAELWAR
jgi:hypothetical protein